MEYLSSADLMPPLQSDYREDHSTETAVLRVLRVHSDILQVVDNSHDDLAVLVLLDLSATFDTVDHSISINYQLPHCWLTAAPLVR